MPEGLILPENALLLFASLHHPRPSKCLIGHNYCSRLKLAAWKPRGKGSLGSHCFWGLPYRRLSPKRAPLFCLFPGSRAAGPGVGAEESRPKRGSVSGLASSSSGNGLPGALPGDVWPKRSRPSLLAVSRPSTPHFSPSPADPAPSPPGVELTRDTSAGSVPN